MIGKVTRVSGTQVWVQVPSRLPGVELGPLQAVTHRYFDKWQADSGTATPGAVATNEKRTAYQAGDRVLVLEDGLNEFVVVGIID